MKKQRTIIIFALSAYIVPLISMDSVSQSGNNSGQVENLSHMDIMRQHDAQFNDIMHTAHSAVQVLREGTQLLQQPSLSSPFVPPIAPATFRDPHYRAHLDRDRERDRIPERRIRSQGELGGIMQLAQDASSSLREFPQRRLGIPNLHQLAEEAAKAPSAREQLEIYQLREQNAALRTQVQSLNAHNYRLKQSWVYERSQRLREKLQKLAEEKTEEISPLRILQCEAEYVVAEGVLSAEIGDENFRKYYEDKKNSIHRRMVEQCERIAGILHHPGEDRQSIEEQEYAAVETQIHRDFFSDCETELYEKMRPVLQCFLRLAKNTGWRKKYIHSQLHGAKIYLLACQNAAERDALFNKRVTEIQENERNAQKQAVEAACADAHHMVPAEELPLVDALFNKILTEQKPQ